MVDRDQKKRDKRERILDAAMERFARYGIRKTTIEEIAHAAGVGKGTIYLYFKSKEDVFAEMMWRMGNRFLKEFEDEVAQGDNILDLFRQYLIRRFQFVQEQIEIHRVTRETHEEIEMMAASHPVIFKMVAEMHALERKLIETILLKGEENGELEIDDVTVTAQAIVAASEALEKPWALEGRELPIEKKAEILIKLFVEGMRKRS